MDDDFFNNSNVVINPISSLNLNSNFEISNQIENNNNNNINDNFFGSNLNSNNSISSESFFNPTSVPISNSNSNSNSSATNSNRAYESLSEISDSSSNSSFSYTNFKTLSGPSEAVLNYEKEQQIRIQKKETESNEKHLLEKKRAQQFIHNFNLEQQKNFLDKQNKNRKFEEENKLPQTVPESAEEAWSRVGRLVDLKQTIKGESRDVSRMRQVLTYLVQ
eukprot:TRINITY_DN350_c0_g3_i1.p1 TRINITY_DN350_c0_g3~~TRINITY_DN350_c0_g3_i1.p1  ORF type:complete len:220 (-),score=122.95 TRINITY_DN350_c0_g3_i1:197-856(-)